MTIQDIREGIMIMQAANLGNPPNLEDPSTEQVLLKLLDGMSRADYLRAVVKISQEKEYWPTVFQIIQAARPQNVLSASEAWEVVQLEMNRTCGLPDVIADIESSVIRDVVKIMGGLNNIWPKDSQDEILKRNKFERKYNKIVFSDKMITGGEVKELEGKHE
jgi:hypothetical protein